MTNIQLISNYSVSIVRRLFWSGPDQIPESPGGLGLYDRFDNATP